MTTKVYYGEYTLAYWVELILNHKILLPGYQRHFVWNEESMRSLVETFRDKRFVPPVTLGAYQHDDGTKCNYIIDGQQRLTSLLLAYLDIFPDKEKYKAHMRALACGDELPDEDGEDPYDNVLEWTFDKLVEKGRSKNEITAKLEPENYKTLGLGLTKDFWEHTFLGFSYIVPLMAGKEQQKFYTKTFREMNVQGEKLLAIESRRSLYFLNEKLEHYFEPDFVRDYKIKPVGEEQQMDFARYLCFMSAYHKHKTVAKIGRGYGGKKIEKYIENYVYSVVDDKYEDLFGRFSDIFNNGEYEVDMAVLENMLEVLDVPKNFPSIINMDVYFFGLIYEVLFCHKKIDMSKREELNELIKRQIGIFRADDRHTHIPAQFQYMRRRVEASLAIYHTYSINR